MAAPPAYSLLENQEENASEPQSNAPSDIIKASQMPNPVSSNSQYAALPQQYMADSQQQCLPSDQTYTFPTKPPQRPKFMDDISVAPQTTTTVIVNQPLTTTEFGEYSARCFCPTCHQHIITATESESGTYTWVMCCLICFFCGLLPGLIPFCVPDCQDVRHTCPNCKNTVAVFER